MPEPTAPEPTAPAPGAPRDLETEEIAQEIQAAQAETELEEYLTIHQRRWRLFPRAILVGLAAGLIAILFRALILAGDHLRDALILWAHQFTVLGWLIPIAFCTGGALLAVWATRRFAPEAAGSGIPHTEAVLHRLRDLPWRRVLPVKLLGGALAMTAGLVVGREGPTIQLGGASAAAVAEWLHSNTRERLTLIAAGAGAGLAAAFNAPLAGLVFVLEEMQRDFRPGVFGAAFIAAAVADILARLASGQMPVFIIPSYPTPPLVALPAFALLGLLAGGLGVLFNRTLLTLLDRFARFQGRTLYLAVASVGAVIGLVGWFNPMLIGSGHALTESILAGGVALSAIPGLFLLRFGLTISSYSTGAPGGIFAPLLVLGSLLGLATGDLAHLIAPAAVPEAGVFAVVGMAALFTGVVRAPLTGIVLILEMTGNYNQMLPLVVASFCAYALAEALHDLPIYQAFLQRDLRQSGSAPHHLDQPIVLDLIIEQGAPFAGRALRDLGLPPGCIIVRCQDGGVEFVPTAATRLEPHMRITAVIAPEAADGIHALHLGCGGHEK